MVQFFYLVLHKQVIQPLGLSKIQIIGEIFMLPTSQGSASVKHGDNVLENVNCKMFYKCEWFYSLEAVKMISYPNIVRWNMAY